MPPQKGIGIFEIMIKITFRHLWFSIGMNRSPERSVVPERNLLKGVPIEGNLQKGERLRLRLRLRIRQDDT
jgi:hypothetical protein